MIYNISDRIFIQSPGSGVGLGGTGVGGGGVKKYFFEIQPNFWCVSYSHEWHVQQHNFFGPCPLGP